MAERTGINARRGEMVEALEGRVMLSVNVAIDTTQQFQKIEGFGTAVASANSLYESSAFQKMYYSDLGSSILRLPLRLDALTGPGGSLAGPVTLGPDLQADIALFNFQQPDVQADGQLAAASKTYGIDSVKVIGSIWSPPNWMKGPEVNWYDGQPNGILPTITNAGADSAGGSLIDTPAGLQQFGRYVAAYVQGFQQAYGIQMYAVNIQNELAFDESYSSCEYSPQIFVDAIKAVHDAFVQYGITTKIAGPDDVGVGPTDLPWLLWRQMQYINAVRADPVAMADLDVYNIHGYANDPTTPFRSPTMWDQYVNGRSPTQYPSPSGASWTGIAGDGKESWQTEMANMPQTPAGALLLAENVQDALVKGDESAWLFWQTADGSPANQGTLTGGTDETTKNFAAAQQFYRYVRPDSSRVSATPTDPNGVYVSAFLQKQDQTLTTVLVNAGTTDQTVNISVSGSNLTSFDVDRRTSATDTFADEGAVQVVNGIATITLPAGAIVTLQGSTAVAATATAAQIDSVTQGQWVGKYGADGYDVFNAGADLPSYATVSASGNQSYVWNYIPVDNRSPETDPTSGNRINACYYSSGSFTLDVNLTDGKAHQVALYLLDADRLNRSETVQVSDAVSGTVLDTDGVSNFQNGKYLVWNVSGHVDITISNGGGWNAVASGLFIDPVPAAQPTNSASFVRADASTGGTWSGVYGPDGYDVFNGGVQLPSYAQVSTSNAQSYVWGYIPIDGRSTQTDPTSGDRINACLYSPTSFTLDLNLTDGKMHQAALYLLDSDNLNRSETVQVSNGDDGTVLDTRSVSNFQEGEYLVWNITGHVKISIANAGGVNAVASALLFG